MRSLRPSATLLVLLCGLGAAGCASLSRGDRLWEQGRHREALEAYRRLERTTDEAAPVLLREGLLYAAPDTELHDLREARRLLGAVVERSPGTVWAQEASLVLAGLDAQEQREALESEMARMGARLESLQDQDRELRGALEIEGTKSGGLVERLQELHEETEHLRQEVTRLKAEIAQLKAIDLDEPPDLP